jgi:ubiquinone biosynthesis protein UbiJ
MAEAVAGSVAGLLRRSLGHLASEVPDSYRHLLTELGTLVVALDIDGEIFSVCGGQRVEVSPGAAGTADATVTTSRSAILDVLDAEVALHDAVEAGQVEVRGSLDDVVRAHDTLMAFAHAAVRAPSVPGLLAELRAGAAR